MIVSFGGKTPQDNGAAFVAPNATVLGDVILEAGSSVWYGAVLRGDDGTLTLGENTNVQDNAVLHCDPGGAVSLGKNVTVGHSALVHGCTVGDGSLIGMHATLLNHCVIGKNCIIGAGALVPEGMVIPDGSVAGAGHQDHLRRTGCTQRRKCAALCHGREKSRCCHKSFTRIYKNVMTFVPKSGIL